MEEIVGVKNDKSYYIKAFLFRWGITLPGITAQIIFGWLPLIIAVLVSFQSFNFQRSTWCGLDNYKAILKDPLATPFSMDGANNKYENDLKLYEETNNQEPNAIISSYYRIRSLWYGVGIAWRNTLFYAALMLSMTFFLPILVAILLMEMPPWLIRIMMLLWFLPIASMASIILIKYFYNVEFGLLNGLLGNLYDFLGTPIDERSFPRYLNSPDIAMISIVAPSLIMYMPGLIYITALQGIPQDLYDAAEIDGCGFFKKILFITLPRLRPIISTMLVFSVIAAFQVFAQILIMTQGGPANKTLTLAYYIYKLTFDYLNIGKANALAVFFFIFLLTLTILQRVFIKDSSDTSK